MTIDTPPASGFFSQLLDAVEHWQVHAGPWRAPSLRDVWLVRKTWSLDRAEDVLAALEAFAKEHPHCCGWIERTGHTVLILDGQLLAAEPDEWVLNAELVSADREPERGIESLMVRRRGAGGWRISRMSDRAGEDAKPDPPAAGFGAICEVTRCLAMDEKHVCAASGASALIYRCYWRSGEAGALQLSAARLLRLDRQTSPDTSPSPHIEPENA